MNAVTVLIDGKKEKFGYNDIYPSEKNLQVNGYISKLHAICILFNFNSCVVILSISVGSFLAKNTTPPFSSRRTEIMVFRV